MTLNPWLSAQHFPTVHKLRAFFCINIYLYALFMLYTWRMKSLYTLHNNLLKRDHIDTMNIFFRHANVKFIWLSRCGNYVIHFGNTCILSCIRLRQREKFVLPISKLSLFSPFLALFLFARTIWYKMKYIFPKVKERKKESWNKKRMSLFSNSLW